LGNDRIRIAEGVAHDWELLNAADRDSVRTGLMAIDEDPILGAPLFEPLRGLWSCRIDAVRIIYRIVAEARFVVVVAIGRVGDQQLR
jgi:mRNA-degrading endonuclease RelE of RelBE toxin-antitoxin system